jgi:hypothetical protein
MFQREEAEICSGFLNIFASIKQYLKKNDTISRRLSYRSVFMTINKWTKKNVTIKNKTVQFFTESYDFVDSLYKK